MINPSIPVCRHTLQHLTSADTRPAVKLSTEHSCAWQLYIERAFKHFPSIPIVVSASTERSLRPRLVAHYSWLVFEMATYSSRLWQLQSSPLRTKTTGISFCVFCWRASRRLPAF